MFLVFLFEAKTNKKVQVHTSLALGALCGVFYLKIDLCVCRDFLFVFDFVDVKHTTGLPYIQIDGTFV